MAELVAVSYIPKPEILWAPVADTTLAQDGTCLRESSALGIFVTGAIPADERSLPLLYQRGAKTERGGDFLAMASEPDDLQHALGAAAPAAEPGAGNLGGNGLGESGMWLARPARRNGRRGGGGGVRPCGAALWLSRTAADSEPGTRRMLVAVLKDLWQVARTRAGILALLICFLPIGSGAASNLWAALADDWHASANTVALATGVFSGVVSALGCLAGGYGSDRMDRKTAYLLYGLLMAMCTVAMALAPRTEAMYVVFTLTYAFIQGLTYAGFTAVVLETIGLGAAATKYNVYASLSNMPIAYMTLVDGWAHTRWGAAGLLNVEAAIGVLGLVAFLGISIALPRRALTPR